MIILCNTLLPKDRAQLIPADVGEIFEPTTLIDKAIEVDVAPILTFVSTDSNIAFRVLLFLYFFFHLMFFL